MARPTDYSPEFCQEAVELCANGATDAELAEYFGVTDRTIYRWKAKYPEFCQALKTAKDAADERVERSLYHKAVGYSHEAVKIFMPAGAKEPVYAPYTEHVPPDTTAAIFWLKNRRAGDWRDKSEVHHKHSIDQMSDDELERIAAGRGNGAIEASINTTKPN